MMKKAFDRFCYKYERFGISNLMDYIAGGYIISFVAILADPDIFSMLTFDLHAILRGEVWRLLTFLLIPPTRDILFIVFAVMFAVFIGRSLEAEWGKMRLTVYYFTGALLSVLVATIFTLITGFSMSIDNTYLILSLVLAFGTVFPDHEIRLMLVLPVPAKMLALIGGVSILIMAWRIGWPLFVIPIAAIGNYLLFFAGDAWSLLKQGRSRISPQRTAFRRQAKSAQSKKRTNPRHTCAQCGITDIDDPGMEFRYCSLCSEYSCYCSRHLFSHEHK